MLGATFQVAESQGADLAVTLFDSEVAGTWYPPKPLSLADFHVGLAQYIKGGSERARQHEAAERLNLALVGFQEYLQKATPAAEGCSKLLTVAQSTAGASAGASVVIVGANVCTTPRIQLRTQEDRRLILLVAPSTAPGHDNGDCALQQTERRLHLWFPNAAILPAGNPTALTQVMSKDRRPAETGQLVVFPCSPRDRRPAADHPAAVSAVHVLDEDPPSDAGVRLIMPRPHEHVGRVVAFQGVGGRPGETLLAVMRVGNEFWPESYTVVAADSSFVGEAVAGRPGADCGVTFELRIFRIENMQKFQIGSPVTSWPQSSGSLPVQVVRTQECGPSL